MNDSLAKEYQETEYQRGLLPYKMYLNALEEVFDFSIVESLIDLGCSNGRLIEAVKRKYPDIKISGVDYFEWAKKYAHSSVKDYIQLMDLSKMQSFASQYEMVNCSEVGEHIEREAEDIFLDNLIRATKDVLVLIWASGTSKANEQHQNPRSKRYIVKKMQAKGLVYWKKASLALSRSLKMNLFGLGYQWWAEGIMVFKKPEFLPISSHYFIQKIHTDDAGHAKSYQKDNLYARSFQSVFMKLTKIVQSLAARRRGGSILRISDGDYYFLRKIAIGSAKPGRRALTKSYDAIDTPLFKRLLWQNDIVTLSVEKKMHRNWKKYFFYEILDPLLWKLNFKIRGEDSFKYLQYGIDLLLGRLFSLSFWAHISALLVSPKRGLNFREKSQQIISKAYLPMDVVYALVATKWVFKNFKNQIGLIAGGPKLNLIKKLMEYQEYRNYLGTDSFTDYIEVPQIGAADDIVNLAETLKDKILDSQTKIFLVGIGSSKTGLLPMLKGYTDAVFIDVGCGIDAIAGIVCQDRPFFADWKNYRIKGYDYSKIDFMDQGNPAWNKKEYQTKFLDSK